MTRWELWEALGAAVRASFPDRADALLASVERWLDPGPWSVPRSDAAATGARATWSRDRVLADVQRALTAHDPDAAPVHMRELERWILDAARTGARAQLGLRAILPVWGEAVVDWASVALEAGLDSPSLRILAGTQPHTESDVDEWLFRALRELGIDRDATAELRAASLWIARETVQGRMETPEAVRRMRDLADEMPEGDGDRELWGRLYWEYDSEWRPSAVERFDEEVLGALRASLGAT